MIEQIIESVREREFRTLDAAIREAIRLYQLQMTDDWNRRSPSQSDAPGRVGELEKALEPFCKFAIDVVGAERTIAEGKSVPSFPVGLTWQMFIDARSALSRQGDAQ